jgi:hypothetical protein
MPRVKNTTKKEEVKKEAPEIMEFEDFVARKSSGSKKKKYSWAYLSLILLIVALSAFLLFDKKEKKPVVESSYKIIYLDNNIVYYAKIAKEDAFNIYLSDVYFIDTQNVEKPPVKEGDEPITESVEVLRKRDGAAGWLAVNRQKVFGFEDLPTDSKIIEMIKSYK